MKRQICATNLEAQNEAQGKTVRLKAAVAKPDYIVDDIQALLGKIYYLKHPGSRLLVLYEYTSNF